MELKDDDKYVIFKQDDLFAESFPVMKEIRRQGKLCDVTLKVKMFLVFCFAVCGPNVGHHLDLDVLVLF